MISKRDQSESIDSKFKTMILVSNNTISDLSLEN